MYNVDYIKEKFKDLTFSIDDDLFLEMLFLKFRGETIKFATFLKKQQMSQEKKLLQDIINLETTTLGNSNFALLEDKKFELENLRKEKVRGHITRTRLQWLNEGEKPTSFFCKLEKKHCAEKTMKKLETNSGTVVTGQKHILKEIQNFYCKLFKSKDCNVETHNQKEEIKRANVKCIPKVQLGQPISVTELGSALKKMKNSKSPGIDGISVDFLKVFWGKLKFFITNAINSCYSKGIMSTSMRQAIITCIPKGDKDRKFIKNWRPISLLTVIYKLASSVIAERIKPFLNAIISEPQSGFIPGRCIGDCTRLIYDLMFYTEKHHIPGLLMQIDFEKTFDSVSWKFLYNVLESFGFDDNFIKWVKLFNTDIKAYVTQCGFLSDPILIERGCRQGDPLSPYLFILVAEVLCSLISRSPNVIGFSIGNTVFKLTQFADDTTLILDGSANSLQAALNILEIFGDISGLKINMEKTKLIWIGSEISSTQKLKVSHKLQWGENIFNLLGINFSNDLNMLPILNYQNAISKAKKIINSWKYRYLTPLGKITVIKTLILSVFTHLFMAIPTPIGILNEINKLLFNFVWDGKPDKIVRDRLCTSRLSGGLNMTNIYNFEKSMKTRWLKQMLISNHKSWLDLLQNDINLTFFSSLGSQWCLSVIYKLNPFWKTVFTYFNKFSQNVMYKTNLDILSTNLWLNKPLGTENIYFVDWFKNGIHVIGDIVKSDGHLLTLDEIKNRFGFKPNFFNYFTMRSLLKKFIEQNSFSNNFEFHRPYIPLNIRLLVGPQAGSKNIYKVFQQSCGIVPNNELKWNQSLDCNVIPWRPLYKSCFYSILDNHYAWFQYRILHRILGVQDLLFKVKISDTNKCRLCGEQKETIIHLFTECRKSVVLWENLLSWIHSNVTIRIELNKADKILGYVQPDSNFWSLNLILTVTRYYIFTCAKATRQLNIYHLQSVIKQKYLEQETLSKLSNKNDFFEKNWSVWKNIFINI